MCWGVGKVREDVGRGVGKCVRGVKKCVRGVKKVLGEVWRVWKSVLGCVEQGYLDKSGCETCGLSAFNRDNCRAAVLCLRVR